VSKTGVWLRVGQYTGYSGTKTLGTGPIKWSIPLNESDGRGNHVKDLLYITYPTSLAA